MTNARLGGLVAELADLMALDGADRRRVSHYRRAASVIRRFDHSLSALIEGGTDLSRVPGIGKGLAGYLCELVRDGASPRLEHHRTRIPAGLPEVLRLDGVGVARARTLWAAGIDSVEKLGEALAGGELRGMHGFGPAVVDRVRRGLAEMAALSGKSLLSQADRGGREDGLVSARCGTGGGGRRGAAAANGDCGRRGPRVRRRAGGVAGGGGRVPRGVRVEWARGQSGRSLARRRAWQAVGRAAGGRRGRCPPPDGSGGVPGGHGGPGAPHGSGAHAGRARRLGRTDRYGEGDVRGAGPALDRAGAAQGRRHPGAGRPRPSPPGRARRHHGRPPRAHDLERRNRHGSAHGAGGCGEGVPVRRDHRPLPLDRVVAGVDAAALRAQAAEIARVQEHHPDIRILRGCEVDILPDGALDLDDEVLSELDVVLASVHSVFDMTAARMTDRIVRAMENPFVDVLCHPTGRKLGRRGPYPVDVPEILRAARRLDVAVEVNGSPRRLDLDHHGLCLCGELGVRVVVSSDAHSVARLDNVGYGVDQARRGWLQSSQIVNTGTLDAVSGWIGRRRR